MVNGVEPKGAVEEDGKEEVKMVDNTRDFPYIIYVIVNISDSISSSICR